MCLAGFCLAPLIFLFLQVFLGLRFAQIAWLLSAYFCVLWAWVLTGLSSQSSAMRVNGLICAMFTAVVGVTMLLTWRFIPIVGMLYSWTEADEPLRRLMGYVFGVGLCEELCKAAPLLLFAVSSKRVTRATDGLFLGMMAGLGFAMTEGVEYTLKYWSTAAEVSAINVRGCLDQAAGWYGVVEYDEFVERLASSIPSLVEEYGRLVVVQVIRFISLPILHAVWTGLVGYASARAFLERRWGLLFSGLGVAASLHGLYNFFSPTAYSLVVSAASVMMTLWLMIREQDVEGAVP
jgi:RsiW-degrading membrane proteinase PrsW (M82 family)